MLGKVKWYSNNHGYGFAKTDEGEEVFLHKDAMVEPVELDEEDIVEFDIEEDDCKYPRALNIKKAETIAKMPFKVFESSEGNVWKYVFTKDDMVAEAVLYKYEDFYKRTVICCSTQSGCRVGCRFCLPAGSKILMADFTYKNVEDIKIGDRVLGNQLTNASNGYSDYSSVYSKETSVLNLYKRPYVGKMITIVTEKGHVLKGTENHPVAIQNGTRIRNKFIPMCDVVIGDNVLSCYDFEQEICHKNDAWRIGWLQGFTHGDGVFSKRKDKSCSRWSLSQSHRETIEFARQICIDNNIRCCNIWPQNDGKHKTNYRFEIGDEGIKVFEQIVAIHQHDSMYKRGYLAGFWDAEGYSFRNNKMTRVCNSNVDYLNTFLSYVKDLGYDGEIQTYKANRGLMVLETTIPRLRFIQECAPVHPKQYFIKSNRRVKSLTRFDRVVSVTCEDVSCDVYNFETEENTYIANNVVVHNCGTGNKFVRNLTTEEIVGQIKAVLKDKDIENVNSRGLRFQIMFMSMGEPLHNWDNVEAAIRILHKDYPNAELLLSTIAPDEPAAINKMIKLSQEIEKIGLQFSIHKSTDKKRDVLIPFNNKLRLEQIRDLGLVWWEKTGRHPYLNYCIDGINNTPDDIEKLQTLFSPVVFNFTFSVVCSPNENMKEAGFKNLEEIRAFEEAFLQKGYNTRIFDPAGQDDIGGGCGQLWYVQQWLKEHN